MERRATIISSKSPLGIVSRISSSEEFDGLSPEAQNIVCQYAERRGVTKSELENFLDPGLDLERVSIPASERAISRLAQAFATRENILVYGDYDADGVTATAMLVRFFQECAALTPRWEVPDRERDGYGLNVHHAQRILQVPPGLLIVLDSGSNSGDAIRLLRRSGTDVIIIDHHPVENSPCPEAILINPKMNTGCRTGAEELCTAGLVLAVCAKAARALGCAPSWDRNTAMVLAAVATLADACRLVPVNRAIIKHGLRLLNDPEFLRARPELAIICGQEGSSVQNQRSLQFGVIPKINALGRLGPARPAVELLLAQNPSRVRQIWSMAEGMNLLRQDLQQRIVVSAREKALLQLQRHPDIQVLVLSSPEWHHGVVGPSASRIAEIHQRSAILIGRDNAGLWRGSGRSFGNQDLSGFVRKLKSRGLLTNGGGHSAAIGVTLTPSQLTRLMVLAPSLSAPRCEQDEPANEAVGELEQLTTEEWSKVFNLLGPFGRANPVPLVRACGCRMRSRPVALRLRGGSPWASRVEFLTKHQQLVTTIMRNHSSTAPNEGLTYDLELEFSSRNWNGKTYQDWMLTRMAPAN